MRTFSKLTPKEFDVIEQDLKARIMKDKEEEEKTRVEQLRLREKELKRIE